MVLFVAVGCAGEMVLAWLYGIAREGEKKKKKQWNRKEGKAWKRVVQSKNQRTVSEGKLLRLEGKKSPKVYRVHPSGIEPEPAAWKAAILTIRP